MEKGTRVAPELLGRFSNDAITLKLGDALSWLVNLRFSGTREGCDSGRASDSRSGKWVSGGFGGVGGWPSL